MSCSCLPSTSCPPADAGRRRCPASAIQRRRVETEARRRAPTLMTGARSGGQGRVTVWAPRRPRPGQALTAYAVLCAYAALSNMALHSDLGTLLLVSATFISMPAMLSRRRIYHYTTDDIGIGITTASGARALLWGQIDGVQQLDLKDPLVYRIRLHSRETIDIDLEGYSHRQRKELIQTIATSAHRAAEKPAPL